MSEGQFHSCALHHHPLLTNEIDLHSWALKSVKKRGNLLFSQEIIISLALLLGTVEVGPDAELSQPECCEQDKLLAHGGLVCSAAVAGVTQFRIIISTDQFCHLPQIILPPPQGEKGGLSFTPQNTQLGMCDHPTFGFSCRLFLIALGKKRALCPFLVFSFVVKTPHIFYMMQSGFQLKVRPLLRQKSQRGSILPLDNCALFLVNKCTIVTRAVLCHCKFFTHNKKRKKGAKRSFFSPSAVCLSRTGPNLWPSMLRELECQNSNSFPSSAHGTFLVECSSAMQQCSAVQRRPPAHLRNAPLIQKNEGEKIRENYRFPPDYFRLPRICKAPDRFCQGNPP